MTFRISVPGKIHLLGEHTVVYGKPALLSAINLRVYITVEPSKISEVINPQKEFQKEAEDLKILIEEIVKKHFKIKRIPKYKLIIDSRLPVKSGLGSSAAVCAGVTAALLSFLKIDWDLEIINELVYQAEKVFQGNPSGADNSTVVYGGFLWFRKEIETLKILNPISQRVHPRIKQFVLIDSGPKEQTAEMVALVRKKYRKTKSKIQKIFHDQEEITKELLTSLLDGDEKLLIELIIKGERNLESLGVVGKKARSIIRQIELLGGASKIMGGGGVKDGAGMLLCYHKNPKKVLVFAKKNNLKALLIEIGAEGLKIE